MYLYFNMFHFDESRWIVNMLFRTLHGREPPGLRLYSAPYRRRLNWRNGPEPGGTCWAWLVGNIESITSWRTSNPDDILYYNCFISTCPRNNFISSRNYIQHGMTFNVYYSEPILAERAPNTKIDACQSQEPSLSLASQ